MPSTAREITMANMLLAYAYASKGWSEMVNMCSTVLGSASAKQPEGSKLCKIKDNRKKDSFIQPSFSFSSLDYYYYYQR